MDENNKNNPKTAKEAFLNALIPKIETIQDLQDLSESLYGFKFSALSLKYKRSISQNNSNFAQDLIDSLNTQKSKIRFNKLT